MEPQKEIKPPTPFEIGVVCLLLVGFAIMSVTYALSDIIPHWLDMKATLIGFGMAWVAGILAVGWAWLNGKIGGRKIGAFGA